MNEQEEYISVSYVLSAEHLQLFLYTAVEEVK